nr:MAG TPA: hypothetical protein [Bacteriophage sp.]DAO26113.1 MAG TPA: hypothetical protein [Bacteriophage sp.]
MEVATTKPNVKTWVIMYSELIGNYKKYRIKSLYDNKFDNQLPK